MRRFMRIGPLWTAATVALLVLGGCGKTPEGGSESSAYPEKTAQAGEVEIRAQPAEVSAAGATFEITLDTHTTPLEMDLERSVTLSIDGADWASDGWEGDPPEGHHRQGRLRFRPGGPVGGTIMLTFAGGSGGFADTVDIRWPASG